VNLSSAITNFSATFMLLRTIRTCFAEPAPFCFVSSTEQPAHEKIGVVDAQWVVHQAIPSLGNQVQTIGIGKNRLQLARLDSTQCLLIL